MSSLPPPPPGGPVPPSRPVPPPPPGWYVTPSPPPHGGQQHYYYAQPTRPSGLAIASMVLGIVWVFWIGSLLAVIFGHIAISRIKEDRTLTGRGMAIAGLVLGYAALGLFFLAVFAGAFSETT